MTPRIHRHFISTARRVSPSLHGMIAQLGRLEMPDRRGRGFAWFLARVIVGQQLSTSAARSIWTRVETAVKSNGGSVPEFFIEKNARLLRGCGISQNKVKALMAIREAHVAGLLSVQRLRRMTHAERSTHLTAIWGVGQWTADMASIFFFRDLDVWPEGDIGVYRGLERATGKRSPRTLLKIANAFAPYRSFLALYMWRVLDQPAERRRKSGSKQPV